VRAVNLIPSDQRGGSGPAAGRSQGGAYAVLVLLAGLAGLALLYGSARHQISSRTAQAASISAQIQQAQASATQLAPYTSFLALREQRKQAVTQLAQSRFDWAQAFHELGRVLPRDTSVSSLEGTVGAGGSSSSSAAKTGAGGSTGASGSTVTSATPPGSVPVFVLAGCAKNQEVVAQTLNRLRLIEGVSAVTLANSTQAAASGGGGCPGSDPAFSVQITFDPLPAASATSSSPATATASNRGTG
jgi:Tfp pilus assembly protein PilN